MGSFDFAYGSVAKTDSHEVRGRLVREATDKVYSVDLSWGEMKFVYKTVIYRTWNESTNLYDEERVSEWVPSGNSIKVINHSNTDVTANFTYNKLDTYNKVIGTFDGGKSLTLPSAEGKEVDSSLVIGTKKLTLSGNMVSPGTEHVAVGSVKVEID